MKGLARELFLTNGVMIFTWTGREDFGFQLKKELPFSTSNEQFYELPYKCNWERYPDQQVYQQNAGGPQRPLLVKHFLWIKLFDRNKKTYQSFLYKTGGTKTEPSYPVMSISEDPSGNIWAGTWMEGLLKLNSRTDTFDEQIASSIDFRKMVVADISQVIIKEKDFFPGHK